MMMMKRETRSSSSSNRDRVVVTTYLQRIRTNNTRLTPQPARLDSHQVVADNVEVSQPFKGRVSALEATDIYV